MPRGRTNVVETARSAPAESAASDFPALAATLKGFRFVDVRTVATGVILGLITSPVLGHFFGVAAATGWFATILLSQACVAISMTRLATQPDTVMTRRLALAANVLLLLSWTGASVALWLTGDPSGWVAGMSILVSLTLHVLFATQHGQKVSIVTLAVPIAPLGVYMIWAAWIEYDMWVAVLASISSLGTIASIWNVSTLTNRNTLRMREAVIETKETKDRLMFAVESIGDGYFELDLETMDYRPNPGLAGLLGMQIENLTIEGLRDRVHPDDHRETQRNLVLALKGQLRGWNHDIRVRHSEGHWMWMHQRCRVLDNGGKRTLVGTLVDMTDRKKIEDDLRAAKEAAEASSRAKGEFLANMSHEIRTPLNGVLGMAQALDSDPLTGDQREKVGIILDSGKSLMALLNDVLDLSKIEAGKLEVSPVDGDFLHTMKRTQQLFQAQASDKGLSLRMQCAIDFPDRLGYDPVRVRQCVSNLLSNAVKFTPEGAIDISVSSEPLSGVEHLVKVVVTDSGIGMSQDVQAKLFNVFTQADGATTRKFGGSGLGLAISRRLAQLMGGDLTVASEEGKGSTFTFTFRARAAAPLQALAPATAPAMRRDTQSLRGIRVLLTDDNSVNRQVVKLFLAPQGCVVSEATNGQEALDALARQLFDIVLLDVHMPVMDGQEAIQRIRASGEDWSAVPVIALTADAMTGDRERYLALGMSDYVSKPIDQRELVAKMHSVLMLSDGDTVRRSGTQG